MTSDFLSIRLRLNIFQKSGAIERDVITPLVGQRLNQFDSLRPEGEAPVASRSDRREDAAERRCVVSQFGRWPNVGNGGIAGV
jgi:hypothetical protein